MIVINESGEKQVVFKLGEQMSDITEQVFRVTLENNSGNRTKTAHALGVHVRTIRNWCKRWDIPDVTHE